MPNAKTTVLRAAVTQELFRQGEILAKQEGSSLNSFILSLCRKACDAPARTKAAKGKRSA